MLHKTGGSINLPCPPHPVPLLIKSASVPRCLAAVPQCSCCSATSLALGARVVLGGTVAARAVGGLMVGGAVGAAGTASGQRSEASVPASIAAALRAITAALTPNHPTVLTHFW